MSEPKISRSLLIILLVGLCISIAVRIPMINERAFIGYYQNEDAASHLVVTARNIAERPAADHWFLPIFTVSEKDRWIDDLLSASVASKEGDYFYTSFPPLSFALTGCLSKIIPEVASPEGCRWLGLGLSGLAGLLLFSVSRNLASSLGAGNPSEVAAVTAFIYLICPESLHSYCISLWAHQFYELILLGFFLLFQKRWFKCAFVALFLACLTEWSAYFAAIGGVLVGAWMMVRKSPGGRTLLLGSFLASLAAGITMIAWFSLKIPVGDYLYALSHRASARSSGGLAILKVVAFYPLSLGALAILPLRPKRLVEALRPSSETGLLKLLPVLLVGFTLLENLMLSGHASIYTFDRLKGVMFVSFLATLILIRHGSLIGLPLRAEVALTGILSLSIYLVWRQPLRDWTTQEYRFTKDLGEAMQAVSSRNPSTMLAFDGTVRGSLVYYARANVIERYASKAIAAGADLQGGVAGVRDGLNILRFRFEEVGGNLIVLSPERSEVVAQLSLASKIQGGEPVVKSLDDLSPSEVGSLKASWQTEGLRLDEKSPVESSPRSD
jgi:hypothetical protein